MEETWMLQVGQNKGTECNEMRNLLLNVIVVTRVKRNKEQTVLMDFGTHFPILPQGVFSVISTRIQPISKISKLYRKSSDQYRYHIEVEIQYQPNLIYNYFYHINNFSFCVVAFPLEEAFSTYSYFCRATPNLFNATKKEIKWKPRENQGGT